MMDEAILLFRFGLGTVFFLSGLAKLLNLEEFGHVVRDYRLAPDVMTRPIAFLLPPVETILGFCLLLGIRERAASLGIAFLLLIFSVAMAVNLARGRKVSCGCLGTLAREEISVLAIARNVAFLGCAVAVGVSAPEVLTLGREAQAADGMSTNEGIGLLIAGSLSAFGLSLVQETIAVLKVQRRLLDHFEEHA
jgi:hypothetical protein